MLSRTVLFVDDEPNVLNALRRLLRKEEYSTIFADSGQKGLELLSEHEVHLVVSDQRMPDMEGTQFLQKVKQISPDAVRVILSGYADAAVIVESINKGEVYRFIAKPWNDDSLKASLRQCLNHYEILRQNKALLEQTRQQNDQLRNLNEHLEEMVELRTKSLQLSQEILEKLPLAVIGISREGELMLRNKAAGAMFAILQNALPGTDAQEILPESVGEQLKQFLLHPRSCHQLEFVWDAENWRAIFVPLGKDAERGCLIQFLAI